MDKKIKIAISVIEHSGDQIGANLIRYMKSKCKNIEFFGIAGAKMRSAGCKPIFKSEELSTFGFIGVLSKLFLFIKAKRAFIKKIILEKPDLFIGIDGPDFNLHVSKKIKKNNIKTVQYVSPSIWAWRKNRLKKIKRYIDLTLLLFPFEKKIYSDNKIPYMFVGHTLADKMKINPDKLNARKIFSIKKNDICILIAPGSRTEEISMMTPIFLKTIFLLRQIHKNISILALTIDKKCELQFRKIKSKLAPDLENITVVKSNFSTYAMIASDVALIKAGTVSLECMLAKCPMVVGYKMRYFDYIIAKFFVKIPWVSIPNILNGRQIVPEFLQNKCTPSNLANSVQRLLFNSSLKKSLTEDFKKLHLLIRNNSDAVASMSILNLVKNNK